ncbi:hypothetical protein [Actinospica sp.]|uniref:hypothetical protein n=1 Tax=Actinospica sp. TaxID=1872142 RepID=UPI002B7AC3D9|nr:hypothetical protein [Actinospica sp.]HWG24989.1 hypothetical protein [Actinospica sp.]
MSEPTPEPTMTDVLSAIAGLGNHLGAKIDALDVKVEGLEDRLVQRTGLLRADIAGLKAESAIEQAYGRDTAEALRRHIADRNAHGPRAA